MSIITFSVHFLVRLFNFSYLYPSIHPSIHLVSSFIHLVILSSIYFIQLLVHLYHQSISFHFIYPQYYNSCMIHFYSVTCIQTKEHIQFSFFFFLFFKWWTKITTTKIDFQIEYEISFSFFVMYILTFVQYFPSLFFPSQL